MLVYTWHTYQGRVIVLYMTPGVTRREVCHEGHAGLYTDRGHDLCGACAVTVA